MWPISGLQAEAALRVVTDFGNDIDMAKVLGELVAGRLALWLVGHGWVVTKSRSMRTASAHFGCLWLAGQAGEKLSALTSETMAAVRGFGPALWIHGHQNLGRWGWQRLLPDYDALPLEGGASN